MSVAIAFHLVHRLPTWLASSWSDASMALGILTPLVVVPLGVITFYLRGLREQQNAVRSDLAGRIDQLDEVQRAVTRQFAEFERHVTSKEDWLRESMLARHNLERLTKAFARLEGALEATDDPRRPRPHRSHYPDRSPASTSRDGRPMEQEI